MIKRHVVKSCCGSKAFIFETESAVNKGHLAAFTSAGYSVPEHYTRSGVFYVQFKGLIATGAFGSTKLQVKCSSANCGQLLDAFAATLDEQTHK
jgi:hypothetical protein